MQLEGQRIYLPIVIPKKHISDNYFTENFINQRKNNHNDSITLKNMYQKYKTIIIVIILTLMAVYNFYAPNLNLGIKITKVPMICKVDKDSVAEKAGLSKEDVIIKVNGKNVVQENPKQIMRYMYGKNPLILNIKNTKSGEIKDIKIVN